MLHVFYFSALKLANRVFYTMAGVSLFLLLFLTQPLMLLFEGSYGFGGFELWLVFDALILIPILFVVMAILTRRLDKELFSHYVQTLAPEQAKQP